MGVGMCLYGMPSLCKRKISSAKVQLYYNDFCYQHRLTQPYNHIIYPGVAKIYLVFLSWSKEWQMLFNVEKCKVMHFGRRNVGYNYHLDSKSLDEVSDESQLPVI